MKSILDIGHKHPNVSDWAMCGACGSRFQTWRNNRREKEMILSDKKKKFEANYGFDARMIKFMKPDLRKKFGQRYGPKDYAPDPMLKKLVRK